MMDRLFASRLEAWYATIPTNWPEKETRGSHQQNRYADTYRRLVLLEMEQLAGNTGIFMGYWAMEDFCPACRETY